jgi:sugar lactone lactonase YvrE
MDVGELTRRTIQVKLRNNTKEPIGNGHIRIIFGPFRNRDGYRTDVRSETQVRTLAGSIQGSADGPSTAARLNQPFALLVDRKGAVFFSTGDGRIRKLDNGVVSTLATGLGTIYGLCFQNDDETAILAADSTKHKIYELDVRTGDIKTVAGTGVAGSQDGPGLEGTVNAPSGILRDTTLPGRDVYFVEGGSGLLRRMTSDIDGRYSLSTVPGVSLTSPRGLARLSSGQFVTCERTLNRIRLFTTLGVSTFLGNGSGATIDGPANAAAFAFPNGVSAYGETIYFATGHRVRQLSLKKGAVATSPANWISASLAGDSGSGVANGSGLEARFTNPTGLAVDGHGNLLVADTNGHTIREISPTSTSFPIDIVGEVNSSTEVVQLSNASGYVPYAGTSQVDPSQLSAIIEQATPAGGIAQGAELELEPWELIVPEGVKNFEFTVSIEGSTSSLAPPDAVLNPSGGPGSAAVTVRAFAGSGVDGAEDGPGSVASFSDGSGGMAVDGDGNLFVADGLNSAIRRIDRRGWVTTIVGRAGVAAGSALSKTDGTGDVAVLGYPLNIAVSENGQELYFTELVGRASSNDAVGYVRRATLTPNSDASRPENWIVTTIAGGAPAPAGNADRESYFNFPRAIAITRGGDLVIAESSGHRIRRMHPLGGDKGLPANWSISRIAGTGQPGAANGPNSDASFDFPAAIALGRNGEIFVGELFGGTVRRISNGQTTVFAGKSYVAGHVDSDEGANAEFNTPTSLAVDSAGYLYVADVNNQVVRRISPSGAVRTVAGKGASAQGRSGATVDFGEVLGVAVGPTGDVFVKSGGTIFLLQRTIGHSR